MWINKWQIPGSKGKTWTVAINDRDEFACSCPVWKFRRQECKHIRQIKAQNAFTNSLQTMGNGNVIAKPIEKVKEVKMNIIPAIKVGRNFNFDE